MQCPNKPRPDNLTAQYTINGTQTANSDQISFPRGFEGFHLPTLDVQGEKRTSFLKIYVSPESERGLRQLRTQLLRDKRVTEQVRSDAIAERLAEVIAEQEPK